MSTNEFIARNMRELANMSITKLKALYRKLKGSKKEVDKETARIIKSLIEKKKTDYPVIAKQFMEKRFMKTIQNSQRLAQR